jgi:hypothetical protein
MTHWLKKADDRGNFVELVCLFACYLDDGIFILEVPFLYFKVKDHKIFIN